MQKGINIETTHSIGNVIATTESATSFAQGSCTMRLPLFRVLGVFLGGFCSSGLLTSGPRSVGSLTAAEPPVVALAFAPGGNSVVAGSQAGLRELSWPDLKPVRNLATSLIQVQDLTFSPDGNWLAASGGAPAETGVVELLAWPAAKADRVFNEHRDCVLDVAWAGDSQLLTASLDHTAMLLDARSGQAVQRFQGHSRGVTSVCYLQPSRTLITSSIDETLRVWNIDRSQVVRSLNNHTRPIHAMAVRPRTEGLPMIASVSADQTVRLWQPTIGRMVRFLRLDTTPLAVAWLPDGSHLVVTATDGHVRLIDPDTVQVIQDVAAIDGWAYSLAIHPHDGKAVVGGQGGRLRSVALGPESSAAWLP